MTDAKDYIPNHTPNMNGTLTNDTVQSAAEIRTNLPNHSLRRQRRRSINDTERTATRDRRDRLRIEETTSALMHPSSEIRHRAAPQINLDFVCQGRHGSSNRIR